MAQDHVLAGKVAKQGSTARGLARREEVAAALEDRETPKGTLFILFLFGASIVLLWGYMYLTMILRR